MYMYMSVCGNKHTVLYRDWGLLPDLSGVEVCSVICLIMASCCLSDIGV